MVREKGKPGVMLYFTLKTPLALLSMAQRGELFTAILDYAEFGIPPTFEDAMLQMAWGFIVPALDADDERYRTNCLKRRYAAYCREMKKSNGEPVVFDDWVMAEKTSIGEGERDHMTPSESNGVMCDPISITKTNSESNSISVPNSRSVSTSDTVSITKTPDQAERETDWAASRQRAKDQIQNYGREHDGQQP